MSKTNRRQVFYNYPNGAAPLVGILSLLDDESTDNTEFGWWDYIWKERSTKTAAISSSGPFSAAGSDTPFSDPSNLVAGTSYRVRTVAGGVQYLTLNDVVLLKNVVLTGGPVDIKGVVTLVDKTNNDRFEFRALAAATGVQNGSGENVGLDIIVVGSAYREGSGSIAMTPKWPVNITNYSQIFKTAFQLTRNALKVPAEFDRTGFYKHQAKEAALEHMVALENAFLFGDRGSYTSQDSEGNTLPTRLMGGVLWFLRQWELGSVTNNGAFNYRPGEAAATLNSDPNKRIIDVPSNGIVTRRDFEDYLERAFSNSSSQTNEKLVLCGSGFLTALNEGYGRYITSTKGMKAEDTFGMALTGIDTVHGTIWCKSHPLFSQRSWMKHSALVLDVPNLKYRYFTDSDTTLTKMVQDKDADYRKDRWLTEASLELRNPASHILLNNVQSIIN